MLHCHLTADLHILIDVVIVMTDNILFIKTHHKQVINHVGCFEEHSYHQASKYAPTMIF